MDTHSPRPVQACASPNAIACLSCRTRHLKCDAQRPICSRCAKCRLPCTYLQSRRGRRSQNASSANAQKEAQTRPSLPQRVSGSTQRSLSDAEGSVAAAADAETPSQFSSSFSSQELPMEASLGVNQNFMCFSADLWSNSGTRLGTPLDFLGSCLTPNETSNTTNAGSETNAENLVALFYKHFHPAHSFTIPYRLYIQRRKSLPRALELAMQFAGSHFTSTPGEQWQQCPAAEIASGGQSKPTLYTVQALLILAITRYGRNELQESHQMLQKAASLAIRMKMNEAGTVSTMAQGDKVLEQSAIRTWWELVNTLAILSIFDSNHEVTTVLPESDLSLPCEEQHYEGAIVPGTGRSQKDFLDRAFLRDDFEYSSFAYKVEACRLLMALHALGSDWWSIDKDRIHTVHNSISNFHLSMPLKKREVIAASDGNVDEVLFAAKMLAAVATILINRPRSSLAGNNPRPRTSCTGRLSELSFETSKQHTIQALQAANTLADAAATRSSPCTVICHSPFYTCVVALASTVHLPAYAQTDAKNVIESIKERLKLTTNALSRIGENWPIAKTVETQVLETVREVMSGTRQSAPQVPLPTPSAVPANLACNVHDDWLDDFLHGPISFDDMT